jgi:hypothetical protein
MAPPARGPLGCLRRFTKSSRRVDVSRESIEHPVIIYMKDRIFMTQERGEREQFEQRWKL